MNRKIKICFNLDTIVQIYYIPQNQSGIYYCSKFILQEFIKNKNLFDIYGCTEYYSIPNDMFDKVPELEYLKNIKLIKNNNRKKILKLKYKIEHSSNNLKKIFRKLKLLIKSKNDILSNIDCYFSFYGKIPDDIANNKKIKKYLMCHDISPIRYPNWYCNNKNDEINIINGFKENYININKDFTIFTDSQYTREDFIDYYKNFDKDKVIETTISIDRSKFFPVNDKKIIKNIISKYNIDKDDIYFLSLSYSHPRKNQKFLIESFLLFLEQNKNDKNIQKIKLVLAGPNQGLHLKDLLISMNINQKYNNNIITTGFVQDDDINYIMNGALAFVYVSLFEGFGMPILEALCAGVPVISSNTTSMPQIYGNAALAVDPTNHNELIAAFKKMYSDSNLRKMLIREGFKQSKKFSYEKCFNIMKNIIINNR